MTALAISMIASVPPGGYSLSSSLTAAVDSAKKTITMAMTTRSIARSPPDDTWVSLARADSTAAGPGRCAISTIPIRPADIPMLDIYVAARTFPRGPRGFPVVLLLE